MQKKGQLETWYKDVTFSLVILLVFSPPFIKTGQCDVLWQAHFIKDRRCSTAKAIFALQSQYKWALSGTPLQNRVGELYSLVFELSFNQSILLFSMLHLSVPCLFLFILTYISSSSWLDWVLWQVRFLEIYPYSYYFCRACDCKSLDYRWASSVSLFVSASDPRQSKL